MSKFRKIPLEVDAFCLDGSEWPDWAQQAVVAGDIRIVDGDVEGRVEIDTLEGTMHAIRGDWVIRGVVGEFYPCQPGVFAKSYEPVPDPNDPAVVQARTDDELEAALDELEGGLR